MPNADNDAYTSHLALGPPDEVYALMASDSRLMLTTFGMAGPEWFAPIGDGLQGPFSEARVFVDASGDPIIFFRQGGSVQVWRSN